MMKEVARYAEKYGVVVALEDWISAEDNIRLLDAHRLGLRGRLLRRAQHRAAREGHLRGAEDARQAHQPDSREERQHADDGPGRQAGLAADGEEFYEIGYRGWYVLETGSPTKDIVADTRANIEYVKKTFRMPPPPAS